MPADQKPSANGHPALVFYDMRAPEDELSGLGRDCNGTVHLWLERLDAALGFDPLLRLEHCLAGHEHGVLATVSASKAPFDFLNAR